MTCCTVRRRLVFVQIVTLSFGEHSVAISGKREADERSVSAARFARKVKLQGEKKFATPVCCKCSSLHAYHYLTGSGILSDARTPTLGALHSHVRLPIWQARGPDGVQSVQRNHVPAGLVAIRGLHSKAAAP